MATQQICILGATGSIGRSTLQVIKLHPERFRVYALSAFSNIDTLVSQAAQCAPQVVVVPDDAAAQRFRTLWPAGQSAPEIRVGIEGLCATAADAKVDTVMAAIVGVACLAPIFAAAKAGKRILLANKEALVAAGEIFLSAVRQGGGQLLPIDSEHNAIYQCLPQEYSGQVPERPHASIRRLILTASGGPFRNLPLVELADVTPEQACLHPNWSMGKKISVDSATMANKGLEVIEAHWLFAMPPEQISVVIHPQSLVHSMVEYIDGAVLSQLGLPDMRSPIAYGLGFPERIDSGLPSFDLSKLAALDFEPPSYERFPALRLAYEALATSQTACITLNAANEVAVEMFLRKKIRYIDIATIIEKAIDHMVGLKHTSLACLDDVLAVDAQARVVADDLCLTI